MGITSRFASCGSNDSVVNVYFYNLTTQQFTLNQSLTDPMAGNCSSLEMSIWEDRIVVGRSSGDIYIYSANYSLLYSKEYSLLHAHNASVRFVKLTFDNAILLSGSGDGNLSLWTVANNFTTAATQSINATAADWNYYYMEYTVADNSSNVTVFRL